MGVLGIDTAGPVVSLGWWAGPDAPSRLWEQRVVLGADAVFFPVLEDWLSALPGLTRVAVSHGPGAFVGLRVGLASAMGVALARGVRLAPVCALAARAARAEGPVLSLLDARKGRVYARWFEVERGAPRALGPAVDAPLAEVLAARPVAGLVTAVGEGAAVFAADLHAAGVRVLSSADAGVGLEVARLGAEGPGEAPEAVGLAYVRPPDIHPGARGPG
jgi:tRNA threonylcarbamoyladenosine biosynthesis protein TsaB